MVIEKLYICPEFGKSSQHGIVIDLANDDMDENYDFVKI